jgi:hypothetical protein
MVLWYMRMIRGSGNHVFVMDIRRMEVAHTQDMQINVASNRASSIDSFQLLITSRIFQHSVLNGNLLSKDRDLILAVEDEFSVSGTKS